VQCLKDVYFVFSMQLKGSWSSKKQSMQFGKSLYAKVFGRFRKQKRL